MPKYPEVFEQLLPFQWRGVEVPITKMRAALAHDLVLHSYVGVDGARVEDTGMAPMRFTFNAHMGNNIVPGKNESWEAGTLYPSILRHLIEAFSQKANGMLQHPEFGKIECKAEHLNIDWDAGRRGGCDIEMSFVETLPEDGSAKKAGLDPSPVTEIYNAALSLDADLAAMREAFPDMPDMNNKGTLEDLARSIQGIGDQVTLLSMRAGGKIDNIIYRCEKISESVDRAKTATSWQITNNLERIKSAGYKLRETLLRAHRITAKYIVPGDTTLGGVVPIFPATNIGELVRLNPDLMTSPTIKQGTVITYYQSTLPF